MGQYPRSGAVGGVGAMKLGSKAGVPGFGVLGGRGFRVSRPRV